MSSAGPLDWTATLADMFTPTITAIQESVSALQEQFAGAMEAMSASAESGAASLDTLDESMAGVAAVAEVTAVSQDTLAESIAALASSLVDNTAALEANTGALAENAAAADDSAGAHDAANESAGLSMGTLTLLGTAALGAGAAIGVMGVQAVDSLNTVQAETGASTAQMAAYQAQLDKLAPFVGKTIPDLSSGLYDVSSAGYSGKDALEVLTASAESAAAGGTDLHTVTNGLTAILKAFGENASQAGSTMDLLQEGVVQGKSAFVDYSNAIGLVADTAHTAGFSLTESAAALSTLTRVFPDARRAGQDLDALLRAVGINSANVGDQAKKMGLNFDQATFDSDNLQQRLQYLQQITGGNTAQLERLTGGANAYSAAAVLMSNNGADFTQVLDAMKNSSGATAAAFAAHSQSIGGHLESLKGTFSVFSEHVVQALQPVINQGLDKLGQGLSWVTTHSDQAKAAAVILAGAILGVLVPSLKTLGSTVLDVVVDMGPFALGGAALAALAILLVTHWSQVTAFFQGQVVPIFNDVVDTLGHVKDTVVSVASDAIDWFNQWKVPILSVAGAITAFFLPALIQSGTQAAIAGGKMAASFIGSLIEMGTQATATAAETVTSLIPAALSAAGSFITMAATAIPAAIGGLIGYAAAGWAAAAATIAATWPILAIIAAIGLLVGAVILIVTHWKQVSAFFVGLWNDIKAIFQTSVNAVVGFFEGLWHDVVSTWNGLIDGIKGVIQAGFNWVKNTIQGAINFVVGLFSWLYQHNYYFKDLVDAIRSVISSVVNWLRSTWQSITSWITGVWNKLVLDGKILWLALQIAIQEVIQTVRSIITTVVTTIQSWLKAVWTDIQTAAQEAWSLVQQYIITPITNAWNMVVQVGGQIIAALKGAWSTVVSDVQGAWDSFIGVITSVVGRITSAVHDNIVQPITSTIQGLISDALGWAGKLIDMFVQGIKNGIGKVGDAAKSVASTVFSFLGFHSPPEQGPLADSDQYPKNFLNMLAGGLVSNAHVVASAAGTVARAMNAGLQGSLSPGRSSTSTGYALAGGGGSAQQPVININLPSDFLAGGQFFSDPITRARAIKEMAQEMANQVSLQGRRGISYTGKAS